MRYLITLTLAVLLAASLSAAHADQIAGAVPSDSEIKDRLVGSLNAQLQYAAVLVERLQAEAKAAEARAKWAVGKLWKLPE